MKSLSVLTAVATLVAAGPVLAAPGQSPASSSCQGAMGYADAFGGRRTFLWRPDHLEATRQGLRTNPGDPAYQALMVHADAALGHAPYSVVDKTMTPASGDKHDYMSMGPYWWPDRSRPDGLPYVRRDGQMNPERLTNAFDVSDLQSLSDDVRSLALAWYFTGDRKYADKAAELLRAWFLDPGTRMNPNLNHGQAVPGRVSGRAEGVIDAHRLVPIVESLGLLDTSDSLSDVERGQLRDWFGDLVEWMATSPIGRAEAAATNNHGIYFDALITHFALYAGMEDVAKAVTRRTRQRLEKQIAPDGRLPEELTRTRSLHYTTWTLTAVFDLADLSTCVGEDLWGWRTQDGRSLRGATDYVASFAGRTETWPWPELDKSETAGVYEVLARGAWAWGDTELAEKAALYSREYEALELNLRLPPWRR